MVTPTKASVKWLEIPELGLLTGYRGKRQEGVDMGRGRLGRRRRYGFPAQYSYNSLSVLPETDLAHLRVTYYRVTYQ
jgi:hypothetical protein